MSSVFGKSRIPQSTGEAHGANQIFCHWCGGIYVKGKIAVNMRGDTLLECPKHPDVTFKRLEYSRSAE